MTVKERINSMFMSKEQTLYLANLCFQCVIGGGFAATFGYQENGLGTRAYSITLILGCLIGVVHAYISTDMKKKKWVFKHFKAIDLTETIIFTLTESIFLCIYFFGGFNSDANLAYMFHLAGNEEASNEAMKPILWLFFFWSAFYRSIQTVVQTILPSIGDVYEQSLYKNQIDYQNHSNAERLMGCIGAVGGAFISLAIGDFIKYNPWIIFTLVILDWIDLWSRWQFYFKSENYKIIKINFAKDCAKWNKK